MRKHWVGRSEPLALTRQCELTGVARSGVYAPKVVAPPDAQELTLLGLIDAEYTRHPFYSSRKLRINLRSLGLSINRKRVQRLLGVLGLAGMAPCQDTSHAHLQHNDRLHKTNFTLRSSSGAYHWQSQTLRSRM